MVRQPGSLAVLLPGWRPVPARRVTPVPAELTREIIRERAMPTVVAVSILHQTFSTLWPVMTANKARSVRYCRLINFIV